MAELQHRSVHRSIVVVGAGIAGISAAVEAAEAGYEVTIVERNPYLGGRVAQLNKYFPKLCPPTCGLEINFQRIKKDPRRFYGALDDGRVASRAIEKPSPEMMNDTHDHRCRDHR